MKTENLHDSELIHYASLSNDPEKRRLAEIASDLEGAERPWRDLAAYGETVQKVEDKLEACGAYEAALDNLQALTRHDELDHDYLQYLARLSKAVNDGRVQLVEDCPYCGGEGEHLEICSGGEGYNLLTCAACDGRGVTFAPADSDSI